MSARIGIDIGGTFTDFALRLEPEEKAAGRAGLHIHKQLTTPDDPARAVLEGVRVLLARSGVRAQDVAAVIHGTTLVTNALIERRGAATAMLVTAGFADVLDIARERRYDMYELGITYPEPLVPRHLRVELHERVEHDGRVLRPLDEDEVAAALDALVAQGVQALAVCLLHSPTHPAHEQRVAAIAAQRHPGLYVSTSAEVFPFLLEYERWTTATMNAYAGPGFDRYLARLEAGLRAAGLHGDLFVMSSSGGMVTPALARRFPVRMLESGPAAGVLQAASIGDELASRELLAFDMGGTTAKGALVRGGQPLRRDEMEVARVHEFRAGSGLPARIPVIDLIEIGSGGGSIAAVDVRGTIAVGPRSAGAAPGPACYGLGGHAPTLTDANLLLGYLDAGFFLGGAMALDGDAAHRAVTRQLAQPLDVATLRAAWGIHEAVNEDITRAFRHHASERGFDLRGCAMVAFGGSGPAHACRVARKLRVPVVVLPVAAGVMSAVGLLASPLAFETFRAERCVVMPPRPGEGESEGCAFTGDTAGTRGAHARDPQALDERGFEARFEALAALARTELGRAPRPDERERVSRRVEMRYQGQGHGLEVALPPGAGLADLPALFNAAYEAVFTKSFPGQPLEITQWKVRVALTREAVAPRRGDRAASDRPRINGHRQAWCPQQGSLVSMPVLDRQALRPGDEFTGPLLVEEGQTTSVIGAGNRLEVHALGHLMVHVAPGTPWP